MKKNVEQDFNTQRSSTRMRREKLAEFTPPLYGACDSMNVAIGVVREEYDSFITQVCDSFPTFEKILESPGVAVEEKQRMIGEICQESSPVFRNFLQTLVRRGRMEMLRAIRIAFIRLDDRRRGRIPVTVTTAAPLDEMAANKIVANLRRLVGGEPEIFVEVDPNVIGGIVVRVGDIVYDASIATQLNKVRQDMIDRSAHEIQSRRDSLHNPEGN